MPDPRSPSPARTPKAAPAKLLNPFGVDYDEQTDLDLVQRSVKGGDRDALSALIRRHQPFVYNVALKMVRDPDSAWDVTQEALLKVVTHLAKFRQESAFRTWLYRIVLNHYLTMKRSECEAKVSSFDQFGGLLEALPSPSVSPDEEVELREQIELMRVRCMSGMLLCLSREQRVVFVLAEVFGVGDKLGGELLEIAPGNFRVRLHRARKDLYTFMDQKCGLVNKANPCRCRSKTKALIQAGVVDPQERIYDRARLLAVHDLATRRANEVSSNLRSSYVDLYRSHPFESPEGRAALKDVLEQLDLEEFFGG